MSIAKVITAWTEGRKLKSGNVSTDGARIFCEVGWRVRVDGTWGTPPSNGGPVLVAERRVSS